MQELLTELGIDDGAVSRRPTVRVPVTPTLLGQLIDPDEDS